MRMFKKDSKIGQRLLNRNGTTKVIPTKVQKQSIHLRSEVRVVSGKHMGTEGIAFWFDEGEEGERKMGIRCADGTKVWVNEAYVEPMG